MFAIPGLRKQIFGWERVHAHEIMKISSSSPIITVELVINCSKGVSIIKISTSSCVCLPEILTNLKLTITGIKNIFFLSVLKRKLSLESIF